jgi:hypothetical protein
VLHALPLSVSIAWTFFLYMEKNTSYEALHCAVFSYLC